MAEPYGLHFPITEVDCEERSGRRRAVRARADVNGIDYVEVGALNEAGDGASVRLYLLRPATLTAAHIEIAGLGISEVLPQGADGGGEQGTARYRITVTGAVDPDATYTLTLHAAAGTATPLPGFDPLLSAASFSWDVNRPSDRDRERGPDCPPPVLDEPDLSYLAKDYAGFRQLVLDRLALIMPAWQEHHAADLGITLVELLAYVGDGLSYYQDAVATEAYLSTARQRISVRRHARLVDYRMHEGCNARALLSLTVDPLELAVDLVNVLFVTDQGLAFPLPGVVSRWDDLTRAVRRERYEVFAPVAAGRETFYHAHNRIDFYTWGERLCCLPVGATHAALRDGAGLPPADLGHKGAGDAADAGDQVQNAAAQPPEPPDEAPAPAAVAQDLQAQLDATRELHLAPGDLLIFEEIRDPATGLPEDADPTHRHAVRLTEVMPAYDLTRRQAVLEIAWARADALPFPLCLSAVADDCDVRVDLSVARGNVVVVDHGEEGADPLGPVPPVAVQPTCDACGEVQVPGARDFYPHLSRKHIVFRERPDLSTPVHELLYDRHPRAALPQITLTGHDPQGAPDVVWWPRDDLLASGGDDRHFVVEVDDARVAHLRFGDGELGAAPPPRTLFDADYRVGEPLSGNVGAEAIRRMILRRGLVEGVSGVRNPLPAIGGTAPEAVADAKLRAPYGFRQRLLRAITPEDYARLVEERFPDQVQRAFARLVPATQAGRYEITVWFDPWAGAEITAADVAAWLYPYRRIGHDVTVRIGEAVPLTVSLVVRAAASAVGETVKAELAAVLGRHGFFDPDRLTFGTAISLSEMVSLAQQVPGVAYVAHLEVAHDGTREAWPDTTGAGADLLTFAAGQLPSLGELNVTVHTEGA